MTKEKQTCCIFLFCFVFQEERPKKEGKSWSKDTKKKEFGGSDCFFLCPFDSFEHLVTTLIFLKPIEKDTFHIILDL